MMQYIALGLQFFFLFFFFAIYIQKTIWIDLIWRSIIKPILFKKNPEPEVISTWESRFDNLEDYPFQPNFFKHNNVQVHYVDQGPKNSERVILCLHGEPSWSYLYRKMIPVFIKNGYRVIAPDFIGFGKSDKFTNPDNYTYDLHRGTLVALCRHLDLKNITLVVQDWGGIIGLGCVPPLQERISELIIMNTGLPTGESKTPILKMIPFLIWLLVVRIFETYLPIDLLFKFVLQKSSPESLKGYNAPFPNASFKAGVYKFPLMVPVPFIQPNPDVCKGSREAEKVLSEWKKPALVLFSTKDPITKPLQGYFANLIPNAKADIWIPDAGHFLQDDQGELVATEICTFLEKEK